MTPGVRMELGPTIMLGSGRYFDYLNPEAAVVTIEDIAYGLASASRFAGQCVSRYTGRRVRYNVAEHCVRMSIEIEADPECQPGDAFDALMHELGESTCGDMTGPFKVACPEAKAIEKRCGAAIERLYRVGMRDPALIKRYDLRMLATEKRDLCPSADGHDWNMLADHDPLPFVVTRPWEFDEAAERFIERFLELSTFEGRE